MLSEVLEALLVIRGVIVQKTKLISDCNKLLKDILDGLLLESSKNKRHFMRACVSGLQKRSEERNGRTSLVWIVILVAVSWLYCNLNMNNYVEQFIIYQFIVWCHYF